MAGLFKLMIVIGLGIGLGASGLLPDRVMAQTAAAPFPGRLIAAGTWAGLGPDSELTYLGNHRLIGYNPTSDQYRLWQFRPPLAGEQIMLPSQPLTTGLLQTDPGHSLTYLGDAHLLDWDPATGQYQVRRFSLDPTASADLLTTQTVITGTLGEAGIDRKLLYAGNNHVLDWKPQSGRYQLWRFDPTLGGELTSFPGELRAEGSWPTIGPGHELVYLGYRRILDWEPATGHYRVWRYDPTVTGADNPLVGEPVAEGDWPTNPLGHQLLSLGDNRLLDWTPADGQYRIWQFDLTAIGAFSADEIAARLGDRVSGVTVLSHGRQLADNDGDALMALAVDIHNEAGGWLVDFDVDGSSG
jgi:hypothetical protein